MSARQLRLARSRICRYCEYVTTARMANRIPITTANLRRRMILRVSFWMRGSMMYSWSVARGPWSAAFAFVRTTNREPRTTPSIHGLSSRRLQEHLLQRLHPPMGVEDGDAAGGECSHQ